MTQTEGQGPRAYAGKEIQMEAIRQKLAPALRDIFGKMERHPLSQEVVEQWKTSKHPKVPAVYAQLMEDVFLWMDALTQEMKELFKEKMAWGNDELQDCVYYILENEGYLKEEHSKTAASFIDAAYEVNSGCLELSFSREVASKLTVKGDKISPPELNFGLYLATMVQFFGLMSIISNEKTLTPLQKEQKAFRVAFETSNQLLIEQLEEFFKACGSYTKDIQRGDDIPVPGAGCSAEMRSNIERYNRFNHFAQQWCKICYPVLSSPPEKFHENLEVFHTAKVGLELSMPKEIKKYANAVMELFDWIRSKLTKTEGKDAPSCFTTKAYNVWCQATRIGSCIESKDLELNQIPGSKPIGF